MDGGAYARSRQLDVDTGRGSRARVWRECCYDSTRTMALLSCSVAIDAGNNACVSTNYDQRGPEFSRVFNTKIGIAAVESHGKRIFANGLEPGPWPSRIWSILTIV